MNLKKMKYETREIWFKKKEKRIYSSCLIPLTGSEPYPTILMAHGFGGSYEDNMINARRYAEEGYATCCFDFCGGSPYTLSDGKTTEMSVLTEVEDMLAVYEQLKQYDFVKKDAIILWGESQGGFVAALCASKLKDQVPAAILFYPAFSIIEDGKKRFASYDAIRPFSFWDIPLGRNYYQDLWHLDVSAEIRQYKGSVILFHGTEDNMVPLFSSRKASQLYKHIRYIEFPGEGHGFSPAISLKADRMILEYLKEIL